MSSGQYIFAHWIKSAESGNDKAALLLLNEIIRYLEDGNQLPDELADYLVRSLSKIFDDFPENAKDIPRHVASSLGVIAKKSRPPNVDRDVAVAIEYFLLREDYARSGGKIKADTIRQDIARDWGLGISGNGVETVRRAARLYKQQASAVLDDWRLAHIEADNGDDGRLRVMRIIRESQKNAFQNNVRK